MRRGGADSLPSGLVTFVFTDIEGSTRLLRRLGSRYEAVLRRHAALLREAWEAHGGREVDATGDSCFAAFPDAAQAISACAEGQRRLAGEPWPIDGRPRVRMGVHTGLASPRGGRYVALAVHQAARVMAAGHGGQVLVSERTASEAATELGAGLGLVSLGRYRLRDFDQPVELLHVAGEGLDTEFPAVRAVPVDGHNLKLPATGFFGRDADVQDVATLVRPGRVVTLAGTGGVGKTRLALEVGLLMAPAWAEGVWLVDLAPIDEPSLIAGTVATAVGAPVGGGDRWTDVLDHLRGRHALVILDNCEQLTEPLAGMAAELVTTCVDVGVLTTSRTPLGAADELVYRLDALGLPAEGAPVHEAMAAPAVRLFVDRARLARPGFTVDDPDAVVRICRRLDGLPLALELAAAQVAVLSLPDLLRSLDDRFRVLRSRDRSRSDRQRTMQATLEWSHRLLAPDQQVVLRRLSVFGSGFSLEGASAAVADGEIAPFDVPELVWSIVDTSLVVPDLTTNQTRYRLLETVRAYAGTLLDEQGETAEVAQRLARWWLGRLGPWHVVDRARAGEFDAELDNLRALVPLAALADEGVAQELACTIAHYYYAIHTFRDSIEELSRYAAQLPSPSPARVSLLSTVAHLHARNGNVAASTEVIAQAERTQAAAGGPPPWDDVAVERVRGQLALRSGDHDGAAAIARQALERDLSDRGRARMFNLLGVASHFLGHVQAAEDAFGRELDTAYRLADEHLIAVAESNVAELALRRGDTGSAARHQLACLNLGLALGSTPLVSYSLIVAARLTVPLDPSTAVRLHAKATELLAADGLRLYDDDLSASEQMLAQARVALGSSRFSLAEDTGVALTVTDAASLAHAALTAVA